MKTKAAIAYAAGKQLEVVTVDLDGPKAGEVLIDPSDAQGRVDPLGDHLLRTLRAFRAGGALH